MQATARWSGRSGEGSPRGRWSGALHLAALWAFAFAEALFEVLADAPDFFVARGNTRGDILAFSLGLVLLPPALMLAVPPPPPSFV